MAEMTCTACGDPAAYIWQPTADYLARPIVQLVNVVEEEGQ